MLGRNVLFPPTFTPRRKTTRAIGVTGPPLCRSYLCGGFGDVASMSGSSDCLLRPTARQRAGGPLYAESASSVRLPEKLTRVPSVLLRRSYPSPFFPNQPRQGSTNLVLTLHQAALIAARRDMAKNDVARQWAKQRDAHSDQHWHARDHQSVDASGGEESLNGDAAVYIGMFEAAGFELLYDFARFARHLLDHSAFDRGEIERATAQYNYSLLSVKPLTECQYNFDGPATDHDHIDTGVEFIETVRLLPACI